MKFVRVTGGNNSSPEIIHINVQNILCCTQYESSGRGGCYVKMAGLGPIWVNESPEEIERMANS